jgi:anaerobic magnesium-protoporphyrin IX monomethyl ester cyclase
MTSVLLIYPYFRPKHNRTSFRFPPLGPGYIASSLRSVGCNPSLLDCTFLNKKDALKMALEADAEIVGIYSMVTMREDSLWFARHLRDHCEQLIAGGPLPTSDPEAFLDDFDIVVMGEGEQTAAELLVAYESRRDLRAVKGIAFKENGQVILTAKRELEKDLNRIAFPARDLFPNEMYKESWKRRFGYSATTVITTRGCPFKCEFCSNSVFGVSYRERSPQNVLDEVEEALSLGYDRIHFADDVFTLNRNRLLRLCDEIRSRGHDFPWECLGRVDSIDADAAKAMKRAGCSRIFFGIESGDDSILKLMKKGITADKAKSAVEAARLAGIKAGAFFILCYPGETDETVLKTIKFATTLPVDYLSFTIPYPLAGTALYERIKDKIVRDWREQNSLVCDHVLVFNSDFSQAKMKFAILKGQIQFKMQKMLGPDASIVHRPLEILTDGIFRLMK